MGRRALAEVLARDDNVALIDADALSYLRVSRDVPLPPGVENHRADAFFRTRFYTGTRLSKTHRVENPREFLYFNYAIVHARRHARRCPRPSTSRCGGVDTSL